MNTRISSILAVTGILAGVLVYTACDGETSGVKEPGTSSSTSTSGTNPSSSTTSSGGEDLDAGFLPDGAPKDCFDNPTTHFQLINGCTNADRVDRKPTLTKLLADGGLPPLQ